MGKTIGQLPTATELQLTDLLEIEQSTSKSITAQKIIDLAQNSLTFPDLQGVLENGSSASITGLLQIITTGNISLISQNGDLLITSNNTKVQGDIKVTIDSPKLYIPEFFSPADKYNILGVAEDGEVVNLGTLIQAEDNADAALQGVLVGEVYYNNTYSKLYTRMS